MNSQTGDSTSINAIELFEGDLNLTAAQLKAVRQGGDVDFPGDTRKASKHYLWPSGVVHYSMEEQLSNVFVLPSVCIY